MSTEQPEIIARGQRFLQRMLLGLRMRMARWGWTSVQREGLPCFLGIGAQKAGTTWLHANLSHHPDIFLPDVKETHYFDRIPHHPLSDYTRFFTEAGSRTTGEITPAYAILAPAMVAYIARLMPDLKLIFLMRDPIERAWSQAMMNLCRIPQRSFDDLSEDELIAYLGSPASLRRGDYATTIETWTRYVDESRLFTAFFEQIAQEPERLLREIFAFLDVDASIDLDAFPTRETVNKGHRQPIPPRVKEFLEECYRPIIEKLYTRFGEQVAHWRV